MPICASRSISGLKHKCSNARFKTIDWSIHSVPTWFDRDSLLANDFRASKIVFYDINMHLICKPCPICGYIIHGSTSASKRSICVNCDVNFRISYRFKHFEYILFPPWYFMQSVFRQSYYCIEITFIIFERLFVKF